MEKREGDGERGLERERERKRESGRKREREGEIVEKVRESEKKGEWERESVKDDKKSACNYNFFDFFKLITLYIRPVLLHIYYSMSKLICDCYSSYRTTLYLSTFCAFNLPLMLVKWIVSL